MASCAIATISPERLASFDKNEVSPKPRRYGAKVRNPAACKAGRTRSKVRTSSGQPCNSSTGSPSTGPPVSKAIFNVAVVTDGMPLKFSTPSAITNYGTLAARHAHMAGKRRTLMPAVDDEIVPLRLACDRVLDRCTDGSIAFGGAQRRAQIGGVLLPETHIERAGAGEAHPVA